MAKRQKTTFQKNKANVSSLIPQYNKSSDSKKEEKRKLPGKSLHEPQTMEELLAQTGKLQFGLKRGEMVEGTVAFVSQKEVLFDIGKKSFGIVSNWELEQVKDYARMLKVGEKVPAQVTSPENDLGYVVLSLRKSSSERRWKILGEKKETGEDIEVTGLEVAKGGLLVEWENLRGFVPATQLDPAASANPISLIGKLLKVKVLEVDPSINRLVLSQKAAALGISPAVLKKRLEKIKPNDVLQGVISGIAPFGLFVDTDGLEGLVHISEIAWEKVENLAGYFKVGDKVEIMVLEVNKKEGKLNLSIKRLTPDPWKNISDRYPIDSVVRGRVVRLVPYGVFIQLEAGIEGLIHISKIPVDLELKVGQEVECIVERVDIVRRKISLILVPKEKPVGYR